MSIQCYNNTEICASNNGCPSLLQNHNFLDPSCNTHGFVLSFNMRFLCSFVTDISNAYFKVFFHTFLVFVTRRAFRDGNRTPVSLKTKKILIG